MNPEEFEKHLHRQPLRQIPQEWRAEILQKAIIPSSSRNAAKTDQPSFLSVILWPNPKAWAGLAAAWVVIFALHFNARESTPQLTMFANPPSPEMIAELRQQQKVLAELIPVNQANDAVDSRQFSPRPHSERCRTTSRA